MRPSWSPWLWALSWLHRLFNAEIAENAEIKRAFTRLTEEEERLNKITESIIGSAIAVHRALGPGLLESAYSSSAVLGTLGVNSAFDWLQENPPRHECPGYEIALAEPSLAPLQGALLCSPPTSSAGAGTLSGSLGQSMQ